MQNFVITADSPTSIIKQVALDFLRRGITAEQFKDQAEFYKTRLSRIYRVPSEDIDEVYECVYRFMIFVQF